MRWLYSIVLLSISCLPEFSGMGFYAGLTSKGTFCISIDILPGKDTKTDMHQIPVLCYHNITRSGGREGSLWIDEKQLNEQLKMLYDSGYHTILPDQLYQHITKGSLLPANPIILSFDDSHEAHYSIAAPLLKRYGFKGVFFVMTVCIGKKGYLTSAQVKALSDSGHIIGCHTYDHPFMTTLKGKQWEDQIDKPRQTLAKITAKPVEYFAYPYGLWSDSCIKELKNRGMKAAFQLDGRLSINDPLFTIRRLMVSGLWSGKELQKYILTVFKN